MELRRVDNIVALYTDDSSVMERFRTWPRPLRRVPYRHGGKIVAVDLYFDPGLEKTVVNIINGQLILDLEYQTT